MGCGSSRADIEAGLQVQDALYRRQWEHDCKATSAPGKQTVVPHLLVELRNQGFVEIHGKDTGGIYQRLDEWLCTQWRCKKRTKCLREFVADGEHTGSGVGLQLAELRDHDRLCDAGYILGSYAPDGSGFVIPNGVFKSRGSSGENNMGKLTMQLIDFVAQTCGWTLQVCDTSNLGYFGQIHEQHITFEAPHPLNMVAPHLMVELSQTGHVQLNGADTFNVYEELACWLRDTWGAKRVHSDPEYCDARFATDAFQRRGTEGESNLGFRIMELVNFMAKQLGWAIVTCNKGNYIRRDNMRYQQLIFRKDFKEVEDTHIMIEIRSAGYIEVNGLLEAETFGVENAVDRYFKSKWCCVDYVHFPWEKSNGLCERKYKLPDWLCMQGQPLFDDDTADGDELANNIGKLTLDLAACLSAHGWILHLSNGCNIRPMPEDAPWKQSFERQLMFTKVVDELKTEAPLLMVTLRSSPMEWDPPTSIGAVEVNGLNVNGILDKLQQFIIEHMDGTRGKAGCHCEVRHRVGVLRLKDSSTLWGTAGSDGAPDECASALALGHRWDGRLTGESNISKWAMRLCDFLVDDIGEWDLIVCSSDNAERLFRCSGKDTTWIAVTCREAQLILRHKRRWHPVAMASDKVDVLGRPPLHPPLYWRADAAEGLVAHEIVPASDAELDWMQEVLDGTHRKISTRDRRGGRIADRFVVVHCLRSEHPVLWDKYAARRLEVFERCQRRDKVKHFPNVVPKTSEASVGLAERCNHMKYGNSVGECFLLHGTNPTSAVAILGSSFKVSFAGRNAGSMFGHGIYLAESSSKADEYAYDDAGGAYNGLFAILVCRAVLGRPYVVQQRADYSKSNAICSMNYDCVVGDRERAVGTFREFVFFNEGSIYPEFAVFYRREFADAALTTPGRSPRTPRTPRTPKATPTSPAPMTAPASPTRPPPSPSRVPPVWRTSAAAPSLFPAGVVVTPPPTPGPSAGLMGPVAPAPKPYSSVRLGASMPATTGALLTPPSPAPATAPAPTPASVSASAPMPMPAPAPAPASTPAPAPGPAAHK